MTTTVETQRAEELPSGLDAITLREEINTRDVSMLSGPYWSEVKKIDPDHYNDTTTGAKSALFSQVGQGHVAHIISEYVKRLEDGDFLALPTFGLDAVRLEEQIAKAAKNKETTKETVLEGILADLRVTITHDGGYDTKLEILADTLNKNVYAIAKVFARGKNLRYVAPIAPVGDCYTGKGFTGAEVVTAADLLLKQVNSLQDADIYLFETNCTVEQAISAVIAGESSHKPYIISFVVDKDGYLKGTKGKKDKDGKGVTVLEAIRAVDQYTKDGLVTYGLNCCSEEGADKALNLVKHSEKDGKIKLLYLNTSRDSDPDESEHVHHKHNNMDEREIAAATQMLQERYCLKVLSVCCGGTARYLNAIRTAVRKGDVNEETLGEDVSYKF